ncbi:ribonuclease HII [Natrialbaceae archaeon GCM10025810]|uniref:ribonuclease HII n=1 Tax=Halovalidus salilacus TaxID=3075124 RepID=UPI0036208996
MPFGVDEAGKGPVFGSMFAAAVWLEEPADLPEGIADSKRLTPSRREALARSLAEDERISTGVAEVTTDRIDDPATDMNTLAVEAHAEAIERALADADVGSADGGGDVSADGGSLEGSKTPIEGLCDACDTDADRFARRVAETCSLEVAVDAEHGADDDSPLVGAASVVAKVERDAHVAAIAEEYADYGDVGSGYPSDPNTRAFLESYVEETGDLPPFARESWSTCAAVLAAAEQRTLEGF